VIRQLDTQAKRTSAERDAEVASDSEVEGGNGLDPEFVYREQELPITVVMDDDPA
jgi:hypothetical protein